MPDYDDTEAPVKTVVDDPDDFSGHMDDRPVKVNVDATDDDAEYSEVPTGLPPSLQVALSPAEAYHFADDLQAAADDCWGAAEYLVTVVHSSNTTEGPLESVLTTVKAPSPEDAVRRAKDLVSETADRDRAVTHRVRAGLAEDGDEFRTYRADSITTVQPDDNQHRP